MKRKESSKAIRCDHNWGPVFYAGTGSGADLHIDNNCNNNKNSRTYNDGTRGYDCHPKYKMSLFVHTNDPDKKNHFIVSDYEVFTHY